MTDDHTPDSKQPGAGWEVSRRHFIYGSAAAVGAAAVLGRVPPLRHRAALASRASGPLSPGGGWTKVQASAPQSGRGQVSLGLPQGASTPGTLLVVTVLSPNTDPAFSFQPPPPAATAGWQRGQSVLCRGGRIEQWYWANNPGGLYPGVTLSGGPPASPAVFTGAANLNCRGAIAEFQSPPGTVQQILDTVGQTGGTGHANNMALASAGGVFAGSLGVFGEAAFFSSAPTTARTWSLPAAYTSLGEEDGGDTVANLWAWSYNGNLTPSNPSLPAGYQTATGGWGSGTDPAPTGWAGLLCSYRAVTIAPIGVVGGEPTNCLDLDPTGQQLIVGGDVEGCWRTANFGDNWQPANYGTYLTTGPVMATGDQISFADIKWSLLQPGYIYACTGKTGTGAGGFLASPDGGCTWTLLNGQLEFDGNGTPSPPRPSPEGQDTDRTVNRLIAQDPIGDSQGHKYLYVVTSNNGVMRSTDYGASWTQIWPTPAMPNGTYYPRCVVVNPANTQELWVGAWANTNNSGTKLGGVWHTSNARANPPTWTQLGGYKDTVADLKVLNVSGPSTYLYAACGTNGIFLSVDSGDLVSLNGPTGSPTNYGGPMMNAIDTNNGLDLSQEAPTSNWVSIDGYLEPVAGQIIHQIIAGCSGGLKVGNNNDTNIVQLTLQNGATPPGYTDLTGQANITIDTLPPFSNAWWHAPTLSPPPPGTWEFWLGGSDSVNPHILIDPNTINNPAYPQGPAIYLCNSGGVLPSTNGGQDWQLAVTGMPMIGMHCFAIDPLVGTHFVHCGDDYTSIDVSADPSGNTPGEIVETDPGQIIGGAHHESHAVCFDSSDSRVYVGLNTAYSQPTGGAVVYRAAAAASSWYSAGYEDPITGVPNTPAVIGLAAGSVGTQRWAVAIAQGAEPAPTTGTAPDGRQAANWTSWPKPGSTGNVAQHVPIVAGNGSYLYCYDRANGIYRSTNNGQSWTQIWNKTTSGNNTGWLALNPGVGELWISADAGLFKMTGEGSGVVDQPRRGRAGSYPVGGQPGGDQSGAPFAGGAAGVAFSPSGAIYAIALPGAAPNAPQVTTLYYSANRGTNSTDWKEWTGDGSVGSYSPPAGQLGISSTGWLWVTGGEHFGCWGQVS